MIKAYTKHFVKKGLLVSRRTLAKNKTARRIGKGIRATLFPVVSPAIYNYSRYAPTIAEYQKQLELQKEFTEKPLISVVMPTYNTPVEYLKECIESVLIQSYANWEFCIADDASPNKEVVETIKTYAKDEPRIKLVERPKNGHISAATNSAIDVAKGDFIALLDHDDVLWPNALFEIVKAINEQPNVDLIYTDEDKIDEKGEIHSYPFFKPDWSPEFLESCNYITHFSCIRTKLVKQVGGLRVGYEGAQDWDLLLRVSEQTDRIVHIPKILYSWRIHEASTAMDTDAKPYVYEAQRKLLEDHIDRLHVKAKVKQGVIKQHASIEYAVNDSPTVSIILADRVDKTLKRMLDAVLSHSKRYPNLEVVVVASSPRQQRLMHQKKQVVIVDGNSQNQAQQFNRAATKATGEYLVFLDEGMITTDSDWLQLLLSDAQRTGVGVVGGKVLNQVRERFMRAGAAMGIYGLYAPLLEGMEDTDIHYLRGLYGQSRRNVSVLDGYFMVKKSLFEKHGGFNENLDDLFWADFCLTLLKADLRHIYNPFIRVADANNKTAGDRDMVRDKAAITQFQKKWHGIIEHDPYLNPSFSLTDAQLSVK